MVSCCALLFAGWLGLFLLPLGSLVLVLLALRGVAVGLWRLLLALSTALLLALSLLLLLLLLLPPLPPPAQPRHPPSPTPQPPNPVLRRFA